MCAGCGEHGDDAWVAGAPAAGRRGLRRSGWRSARRGTPSSLCVLCTRSATCMWALSVEHVRVCVHVLLSRESWPVLTCVARVCCEVLEQARCCLRGCRSARGRASDAPHRRRPHATSPPPRRPGCASRTSAPRARRLPPPPRRRARGVTRHRAQTCRAPMRQLRQQLRSPAAPRRQHLPRRRYPRPTRWPRRRGRATRRCRRRRGHAAACTAHAAFPRASGRANRGQRSTWRPRAARGSC